MANFTKLTFKDGDFEMDVNYSPENNNIWMSKNDISNLLGKERSAISRLINKMLTRGEIDEGSFCAKSAHKVNGQTYYSDYFNLDVVLKICQKIGSNRGQLLKSFLDEYLSRIKEENYNEVIIYNKGDLSLAVNVSPEEDTVWLNQAQIALLFETTQPNISMHINSIFKDNELDDSVHKDFLYTALDGKKYSVTFYNLDLILAVGYRVKSKKAIEFRRWASKVLKQYLLKGYALDNKRVTVSIDNIIALENDVKNIKEEIKDIKEKVFIEPVKERLFFSGQYYDAYEFLSSLMMSAKKSLIIIDPYFDAIALKYLKKVSRGVTKKICKSSSSKLNDDDISIFIKQYEEIIQLLINKLNKSEILIA